MNPFVDYISHHPAVMAQHQALTESEQDELFQTLNHPELPDNTMTGEMADGFLTGCVLSPDAVELSDWLEELFGQPNMPADSPALNKDRLLSLLLRRYRDIAHAFSSEATSHLGEERATPSFAPLVGGIDPEEVIFPIELDPEGRRMGEWIGRDWAVGFFTALQRDNTWKHLLEDDEHWELVAPIMLFFRGYVPAPDAQQAPYVPDGDADAMYELIESLYRIASYWRDYKTALNQAKLVRK
jgi:uncharacterized protein